MNKCANCGHEFEGKFCPECGAKFVDKDACPKCGAVSDGKAAFCGECGARLDGGKTEKSGTAITRDKVKTVVYLSGIICILISALMGLVFAFVSGVAAKSDSGSESFMLYEYFGKAYEDLDSVKQSIHDAFNWASMGEAREFALYFPVVLGTVISAVGLLGVVALAALTCYKVYKKLYRKQEANIIAPAVATYLAFATLATLLVMLNSARVGDTKTTFSDPTLAGLIVGGVFCGIGVILTACSHPEAYKGFKVNLGCGLSVAVSVLTVVVIAVLALPAGGASTSVYNITGTMVKNEAYTGLLPGMSGMLLTVSEDETIYKVIAYCVIGGVAAIALAVISAVILFRKISAVCEGKNKGALILCSVAVALAAIYLAFTILFIDVMIEGSTVEVKEYFAVPVTLLVFTVLALVAEVAGKILVKDKAE